jgi:hypothetical protein
MRVEDEIWAKLEQGTNAFDSTEDTVPLFDTYIYMNRLSDITPYVRQPPESLVLLLW